MPNVSLNEIYLALPFNFNFVTIKRYRALYMNKLLLLLLLLECSNRPLLYYYIIILLLLLLLLLLLFNTLSFG